jgi:hypothetical protein
MKKSITRASERGLTDDVVPKGVLDQGQSVEGDLGDELYTLRIGSMVDASLEDATSVSVGGDLDAMSSDGIVDELRRPPRQASKSVYRTEVSAHLTSHSSSPGCPPGSIGSNTFE